MITVAYRGNFQPGLPEGVEPWSTEHHVARSLEELGHRVIRVQENEASWDDTWLMARGADVFMWTSTYGYALQWTRESALAGLQRLGERIPTVGFHLDLWFGLAREHQVRDEPFFRCRWVFTADGDHDDEFRAVGVNHVWSPPAVFGPECYPGTPRRPFIGDIAFVGNWRGGYHDEWWFKRRALHDWLRRTYRGRVHFWPTREAIRGQALNDLYASVKIVIGDSCFADRSRRYFSDRAFETVGRGGFLVTPYIEGMTELLKDGEHCAYFPFDDRAELRRVIDHYLVHDDERERIRRDGQVHVRENHTYAHRMQRILETIGVA